ncbi:MAG: hypothetical protein ACP5LF_06045, partial [Nitrososphaeria archaeon]
SGPDAWREMIYSFTYDTQKWLRQYHTRSIIETVNSTLKRTMPSPLKKRLIVRKTTEIVARICMYNLRQLVYLKYTKGIDPGMKWILTIRPVILDYLTH